MKVHWFQTAYIIFIMQQSWWLPENPCTGQRGVEEKLQMGFAIEYDIDTDEWKDKNERFSPIPTTSVYNLVGISLIAWNYSFNNCKNDVYEFE